MTTRRNHAQVIHRLDGYLTRSVRSIAASERLKACSSLRRIVLLGALCLALSATPAQAIDRKEVDLLKLYAHSKLLNYRQFQCFNSIITKESRWNYKAINGSHYGLGQMKSEHYRNLDPYRQIDATIKYIVGRYGSMCNAWTFHKRKNYF